MLPTLNISTNARLEAISDASHTPGRTLPLPGWLFRVGGMLVPLLRELDEMAYQWEVPYTMDCAPFEQRFGFGATPLEDVARSFLSPSDARQAA